jgi:hypothetical protein
MIMRPISVFLLLPLLCFSLLCEREVRAEADVVVIKGIQTCTTYWPSGGIFTNQSFNFEVSLDGNHWLIKTIYLPNKYYFTGFDGTNVYSYLAADMTKLTSGLSAEASEKMKHLHPGSITAGCIPLEHGMWVMYPWFAFCSGSVFAERKPGDLVPAPWGSARFQPNASILEPEMTVFERAPHLPKECKFRVSELLKSRVLETNLLNSTDKEATRIAMEICPAGFLGGEYRVISMTNFTGLEIPMEFECNRFEPPFPHSTSSNPWLEQTIRGSVVSISRQHLDSTLPPIPPGDQISVTDTRLRALAAGIGGWNYRITNGVWPVEIPADAIRAFDKGKGNLLIPTSDTTVRRHSAWVVFVLLAFIPPALFFFFRKKF